MTTSQLVIAWTLARPGITFALCGARTPAQAVENAKAGSLQLAADAIDAIDAVLDAPLRGLTSERCRPRRPATPPGGPTRHLCRERGRHALELNARLVASGRPDRRRGHQRHRRCSGSWRCRASTSMLVEKGDFCSGCSAAPSRMIHGGLRYLEYGETKLVRESLRERDALLRNAPHYVRPIETVPIQHLFSGLLNGAYGSSGGKGDPRAGRPRGHDRADALRRLRARAAGPQPRHAFRGRRRTLAARPTAAVGAPRPRTGTPGSAIPNDWRRAHPGRARPRPPARRSTTSRGRMTETATRSFATS